MKEEIQKRILRAVREEIFPACVVGVVWRDGKREILPFGVSEDALFDVASVTKAVPTALLALLLVEEGEVGLDDRVADVVPEIHNAHRSEIRVRHLLTHTVGYDESFWLSALKDLSPEEILRAIYTAPLAYAPGEVFSYTNAASVLLGILIERVSEESLDIFAKEVLFDRLVMSRTGFWPLEFVSKKEILPTEEDSWRGRTIRGEVHDESAWKLRQGGYVVGSAGLFSTVPDLLNVLEMLLKGGRFKRRNIFSEEMVARMHQNELFGIGESHGLGWELCNRRWMGETCGGRTFGKTGFTGCSVMADLDKGVGLVILSSYTYPKRKKDAGLINEVRCDVADIVFAQ